MTKVKIRSGCPILFDNSIIIKAIIKSIESINSEILDIFVGAGAAPLTKYQRKKIIILINEKETLEIRLKKYRVRESLLYRISSSRFSTYLLNIISTVPTVIRPCLTLYKAICSILGDKDINKNTTRFFLFFRIFRFSEAFQKDLHRKLSSTVALREIPNF